MEHETQHRPTFSLLTLTLEADEKVVSEAGALVSHEEGITIETGTRGGVWGSLKRTIGARISSSTRSPPNGRRRSRSRRRSRGT